MWDNAYAVHTLTDGSVTGIRGNPQDPLSRGYICPKGVALADVYDDPDRLRRPIRRVGDDWEELGWDEALDLVADGLADALNRHGRDAVGVSERSAVGRERRVEHVSTVLDDRIALNARPATSRR
jgi:anaerobic selenocysteine-containing dehydrogenase